MVWYAMRVAVEEIIINLVCNTTRHCKVCNLDMLPVAIVEESMMDSVDSLSGVDDPFFC